MTAEEWSALSDTTWKMQSLIHKFVQRKLSHWELIHGQTLNCHLQLPCVTDPTSTNVSVKQLTIIKNSDIYRMQFLVVQLLHSASCECRNDITLHVIINRS